MVRFILFYFLLLLNVSQVWSQIYGCADPQANNYNPLVTVNDGSCLYNSTTLSPAQSIEMPNAVNETSGIFFFDGQYWTHNDDTDAMFFAIDSVTAEVVDTVLWNCLSNIDWEECHVNATHLFIGDIGNNLGNRTDLKFFVIPLVAFYSNDIGLVDTIQFSYEDQVAFNASLNNHDFDAEAFVATSDSLFIFSKCWQSHETKRYALSISNGVQVAKLRETFNVNGLVTGATFFNGQQSIALCGYTAFLQLFVWLLFDYNYGLFFNGNKRRVELGLPFHQIEGVVSTQDFHFYLSNERYVGAATVSQKWHDWNASQFFDNPNGTVEMGDRFVDEPYPNPTTGIFRINIPGPHCYWHYEIYDDQGKTLKKGFYISCNLNFDISEFPDGMYYVHISKRETKMVYPVLKQSKN